MFFLQLCGQQQKQQRHSVLPPSRGLASPRLSQMWCTTRYVLFLGLEAWLERMNEEQERFIAQMMEITNCESGIAFDYLSRTNYDVDIAVRHFYEGTVPTPITNDPNPPAGYSPPSSPAPREDLTPLDSGKSKAVLPRYHSLLQFFTQFITLPIRLPLYALNYVYTFIFGPPPPVYTHIFDYIHEHFPEYDGQKKAVFYKHQLNSLRQDLPTKGWKWIVTYIHEPTESPDFLQSLFVSDFAEQIRTRGGIFFACVMGSDDASKLRPDRSYGRTRKSCVILYAIKGTSLSRKLFMDDLTNPEAVSTNVDLAIVDLIAEDAERNSRNREQNESRRLMEEQNREYRASLQRDLERIAKSKSDEAAAKKAQEEEQTRQREAEERLNKVNEYKKKCMEEDAATGAHDLLIRFPTGKKVIKFNSDDKLEKLFDEAMKSEMCPLYFQMHQTFPKRAVPCLPQWYFEVLALEDLEPKPECLSKGATFQEMNITHGSMVFIENL